MKPSEKPQPPAPTGRFGPGTAVLLGQLCVNLPAILLILAGSRLGQTADTSLRVVFWIAGFLGAWIWYALAVSRWRRWALRQVVDAARLQRYAELTGLLWPKGSPYEKREFRDKK